MLQEQERKMYVDALKKWYFMKERPFASSYDLCQAVPDISHYMMGCSFCSAYVVYKCEGCPLFIKYEAACCDDDSPYKQLNEAQARQEFTRPIELSAKIFNDILEIAEQKGYCISKAEYV